MSDDDQTRDDIEEIVNDGPVQEAAIETIIEEEIKIGFACGIPFSIDQNNKLNPIVGVYINELILNVPDGVIKVIESFFNEKV